VTGPRRLTLRELNRATLQRQWLLERRRATPAEAIGALAGLQAQHANSPYVALWSRVRDLAIADLETALEDRSVVKATVVRATLHLVAATDYHALDAAVAEARIANWAPTAKRAGLDAAALNQALLDYCREPRTVAEMETHLDGIAPDSRLAKVMPAGVGHAAFRIASAGGGLVHVPPSGLWRSHGKPRYVDAGVWLPADVRPGGDEGLQVAVARYLAAYGPASLGDIGKWVGEPRVSRVRAAVEALDERTVRLRGPDDRDLLDLATLSVPDGDAPAPARFLARWDSVLIAYDVRDRILPDAYRAAVIKKNGDFLPTVLVDGLVAGLWTVEATRVGAVLTITPFTKLPRAAKQDLEGEAERLVRFVEPEATSHAVAWSPVAWQPGQRRAYFQYSEPV
jgi:hypothetical protein